MESVSVSDSKLSTKGPRTRSRSSRSRSRVRLRETIKFIHDSNKIERNFEKKFQSSAGDHHEIGFKLNESLNKKSEDFESRKGSRITRKVKKSQSQATTTSTSRQKLEKVSKVEKKFDKDQVHLEQLEDKNQSESEQTGKLDKILRRLSITFDSSKKTISRLVAVVRNWILSNREKNKSRDRTVNWTKLDFKLKNVQRRKNSAPAPAELFPGKIRISEPFKRQKRPFSFQVNRIEIDD